MDAVLLIDKPEGITSFDVIRQVRRIYKNIKIGHAGTLDPFATGLLILLLGKATKLSDFIMGGHKEYKATVELGRASDTLDKTGTVTDEKPIPSLSISKIQEVLQTFKGTFLQIPPMYSAKKVNGKKLYELARKNQVVERVASPVEIFDIGLSHWSGNELTFQVFCSKGTYVRSLGEALAHRLGTVGLLSSLRRSRSGQFSIEDGLSLESLERFSAEALSRGGLRYQEILENKQSVSNDLQTYNNGVNSY